MSHKMIWIVLILTACFCSACTQGADGTSIAPTISPTAAPTPQTGMGSIAGIVQLNGQWSDQTVYVYAASLYGDDLETGFVMLDAETVNFAEISPSGEFFLPNLTPGKYILVVGPTPEQSQQVSNADGELSIIEISAGQMQELGQLQLMQ